jgi:hypothetical protein
MSLKSDANHLHDKTRLWTTKLIFLGHVETPSIVVRSPTWELTEPSRFGSLSAELHWHQYCWLVTRGDRDEDLFECSSHSACQSKILTAILLIGLEGTRLVQSADGLYWKGVWSKSPVGRLNQMTSDEIQQRCESHFPKCLTDEHKRFCPARSQLPSSYHVTYDPDQQLRQTNNSTIVKESRVVCQRYPSITRFWMQGKIAK